MHESERKLNFDMEKWRSPVRFFFISLSQQIRESFVIKLAFSLHFLEFELVGSAYDWSRSKGMNRGIGHTDADTWNREANVRWKTVIKAEQSCNATYETTAITLKIHRHTHTHSDMENQTKVLKRTKTKLVSFSLRQYFSDADIQWYRHFVRSFRFTRSGLLQHVWSTLTINPESDFVANTPPPPRKRMSWVRTSKCACNNKWHTGENVVLCMKSAPKSTSDTQLKDSAAKNPLRCSR